VTARRNTNVQWLSLPALVFFALFSANAACIVRCIGMPCHAGAKATPPCHNEGPEEAPTKPCQRPALITSVDSDEVATPARAHVISWGVPERITSLHFPAQAAAVPRERDAPPVSEWRKLSGVIRI